MSVATATNRGSNLHLPLSPIVSANFANPHPLRLVFPRSPELAIPIQFCERPEEHRYPTREHPVCSRARVSAAIRELDPLAKGVSRFSLIHRGCSVSRGKRR